MNGLLRRKIRRDLAANKAQNSALIMVVVLGVASFVALIGAYRDLASSYARTYEELRFAEVTYAVAGAPASVAADLAAVPGVAAVTGRLVIDTGYELGPDEPVRARLIGLDPADQPAVNRLYLAAGRFLRPDEPRSAVLEATFARFHGVRPGDRIHPILNGEAVALDVVGLGHSPEYLIVSPSQQEILPTPRTFAVIFLSLAELQALSGQPDAVNNIAFRFTADADREAVAAQLDRILAPYVIEATVWREDNPSNAALQQDIAGFRELANLMPGVILLVAAISVYVMLGRMTQSQQPQIGLMRAIGYSRRSVLFHYLAHALTIGLIGLLPGLVLGAALAGTITGTYATELGIPLVETRFHPDLMVQAAALCGLMFTLAGLGPARASARLAPAQAMRLDPARSLVRGRRSFLERLVHPWLVWPLWLRLPWRNAFRLRRRAVATGLGILFAYVLVLMVWGMMDSMNLMLRRQFVDIERWDVMVAFAQPQADAALARVRAWEGVGRVEPLIQLPATLQTGEAERDLLLIGLEPEQQLHGLQVPAGQSGPEALEKGQIILTRGLVEQLGLVPGDEVQLVTLLGTRRFALGAVADEFMSAVAYASRDALLAGGPVPGAYFNALYLQVESARAPAVKNDLYHLPGATSVQLKTDSARDLRELMGLFYAFTAVMLVFAVGMAFAVLFNAMTVNVLERQRELATMRALGTDHRGIAIQLILESLLLWLVVLAPGLLLGHWVAKQMGRAFSAELFVFDVHISPWSDVLTAGGILLTMFLAAWPAIRRVNRLNLADATRTMT